MVLFIPWSIGKWPGPCREANKPALPQLGACRGTLLKHGASIRGTLGRMATPITITIPHQLGRDEARRRIEAGFAKLMHQVPGSGGASSQRWEGDRLKFAAGVMGQSIAGVIDVLDTAVTMEIELPGLLGMIAGGLKDRLQKAATLLLTRK